MNKLLGITMDIEIINVARMGILADPVDAEKFDEGMIEAPTLEPLQVCWDDLKSLWNFHLVKIFTDRLVGLKPEYGTEEKHTEIANHFMEQLELLKKELTKHLRKTDEESDNQAEAHYQSKRLETLHNK